MNQYINRNLAQDFANLHVIDEHVEAHDDPFNDAVDDQSDQDNFWIINAKDHNNNFVNPLHPIGQHIAPNDGLLDLNE